MRSLKICAALITMLIISISHGASISPSANVDNEFGVQALKTLDVRDRFPQDFMNTFLQPKPNPTNDDKSSDEDTKEKFSLYNITQSQIFDRRVMGIIKEYFNSYRPPISK